MSHVPYVSLLELLPQNLMFLYGSLYQSNITYSTENKLLNLNGVDIGYDETTIDTHIETIDNLIEDYKQENEEEHLNMITMLYDIKDVLKEAKDRLSWLQ